MGDVWDFWFEYKTAVPKGYVRLLGKLAELTDSGIKIHFFTGNHDMWTFGYLEDELNLKVYRQPVDFDFFGKTYRIGHGDGLGPGDYGYKFIKKVFANPICQWLFARLHPNFGIGIANYFSRRSRLANGDIDKKYLGDDNEWLAIYSREVLEKEYYDYFVFGHRHLPIDIKVGENSRYINLGDWVVDFTYGVFDGKDFSLLEFEEN